ncbi:MAG: HlyD family efflux transporter periplasmic adaptor subunit [Stigonema ocellatum SAG 48.90 = DSM 106950]|nr:HlyD family efflux transporter periplasmic adaptor subunit [Stigonema ocellatum SAG 48.90 = DSM 106950]
MHSEITNPSEKQTSSWKLLIIAVLILCGGIGAYTLWLKHFSGAQTAQRKENVLPRIQTVTALGYLEPQGKIIKLSASTSPGESSRVEQLLVKQGDVVKAGQVIAILDSRDRLQAALAEAHVEVNVQQSNLAVVKAGAKRGEINAQQAEIARLEAQRQGDSQAQEATVARLQAELQNAQAEAQRYETLYQEGAVSASLRDSKQLTLATAQRNLEEARVVLNRIQSTRSPELKSAKATLARIAEVRSVDVEAAQAKVNQTIAAVRQAKAQLDLAYVRAPRDGMVLDIHTRPGELISSDGIVELGQTSEMVAVLEVYESDIRRVKIGQKTKLFADSRPDALIGKVTEIGVKVKRQNVVNSDTSGNIDARIVEVRVKLDAASAQKVAELTNLQVTGEIQL